MKIKLSLFLSIFFGAFVALLFFGLVAYQSAIDTSKQREVELLEHFSSYLIADLVSGLKNSEKEIDEEALRQWLVHFGDLSLSIVVFKEDGELIDIVKTKNISTYFSLQLFKNDKAGLKTVGDYTYTWSSKKIANSPYFISIVHKFSENETKSFFKSLGVPLIITAALLLWLTTWVTIYMATLYGKLSEQKRELLYRASHDPLTKMLTRDVFLNKLNKSFDKAMEEKSDLSVCCISINNFKEVSRMLGQEAADQLLILLAERCENIVSEIGFACRQDAAEFSVILLDHDKTEAINVAERLIKSFDEEITISNVKLNNSTSIGISIYPDHAISADELLQRAEMSLQNAKIMGSRITVFHADLLEEFKPDINLISLMASDK